MVHSCHKSLNLHLIPKNQRRGLLLPILFLLLLLRRIERMKITKENLQRPLLPKPSSQRWQEKSTSNTWKPPTLPSRTTTPARWSSLRNSEYQSKPMRPLPFLIPVSSQHHPSFPLRKTPLLQYYFHSIQSASPWKVQEAIQRRRLPPVSPQPNPRKERKSNQTKLVSCKKSRKNWRLNASVKKMRRRTN